MSLSPAPAAPSRRSQADRREATRGQLLDAARALFTARGYAETGTPEIVAAAGVTRGALYHHFADKADLLRALCQREADAVGQAIDAATMAIRDPDQALVTGALAYLDAMAVPGRAALLLVEAPAALGPAEAARLTAGDGRAQLQAGLQETLPELPLPECAALADLLSAAFDRTALALASGADRQSHVAAMLRLLASATRR
ncbi:TetR/AcrR family transcriptional regulator [Neotabrizicola sp. sgz301269]|uniref:TetR/AcrR family transcriptional regulator n=1 Tax=Neotabrizicola sp. sgz301269 TaxID=3276282 RepID=UPI00376FEEB2